MYVDNAAMQLVKAPKKFENVPAVGSGPWVVTEQKPGNFVRLERNPNFWGTEIGLEPHVDVIIEKVFNDENSMAAALQRGEIDFGFFDSANILNSLKTKANVKIWGAQIVFTDWLHDVTLEATGDVVAIEGTWNGTHTAPMPTPQGEVAPTGKRASLPFAGIVRLEGDRIASIHNYFDLMAFMGQLGVLPEPAAAAV